MPADIQVQVTLPAATGIVEDHVVNTWHFVCPSAAAEDIAPAITALAEFYDTIGGFISSTITRSVGLGYKAYDVEAPEPRVPIIDAVGDELPVTSSAQPFPAEVASCLSMRGVYTSGTSNARRRGRVFLGPLNVDASTFIAGYSRPDPDFINAVLGAGSALATSAAGDGCILSVWSRADSFFYEVVELWMDNEWDTQRRRGQRATTRTVSPV